ncbi:dethiobiotin synthase [uncultured Thiodictyon sp.]|jgi:dethiobiotin synthetase|uniref:dethiobiotin synthase n=1 Tax=uncultured Thiodictyon sp. TaxID=1846217 RepID=UPI0025E46BD7|nr:dethiobiotin synthase [uncultured Thiodictyon sp.]
MSGVFITGTDTDCGKTEIALGLMAAWQAQGHRVLGMKPVATGCDPSPAGLRNGDALRLQAQGSSAAPYDLINPYAFEPPIAPHLAAGQAGIEIAAGAILAAYCALAAAAERMVVEGIGGWRVPLGTRLSVSDLPRVLDLPVVLVVGLKLGCLNHALLTAESIRAQGATLAGWVGNGIDPRMQAADENIATLTALLAAPCLGVIPWLPQPAPDTLAGLLRLDLLVTRQVPQCPS